MWFPVLCCIYQIRLCVYMVRVVMISDIKIFSEYKLGVLKSNQSYRGKGDYHRLGHGSDDHVRRPKKVAALQGKRVICIATGEFTGSLRITISLRLSCHILLYLVFVYVRIFALCRLH